MNKLTELKEKIEKLKKEISERKKRFHPLPQMRETQEAELDGINETLLAVKKEIDEHKKHASKETLMCLEDLEYELQIPTEDKK
jgi:hypothetical protein